MSTNSEIPCKVVVCFESRYFKDVKNKFVLALTKPAGRARV